LDSRNEFRWTSVYEAKIQRESIKTRLWIPIIRLSHVDQVKASSFLSAKEWAVPNWKDR